MFCCKVVGLFPLTLTLDFRVLCNQQLNERMQQRFASLADVVNKLEETDTFPRITW
jgi:hypothetical protein